MCDLLPATESAGDYNRTRVGRANRGQQGTFSQRLGYAEGLRFESERPGHPAATGVQQHHVRAGGAQGGHFVLHVEDGPLVTVNVEEHFLLRRRRPVISRMFHEKFAQQHDLLLQSGRARVVRQEI